MSTLTTEIPDRNAGNIAVVNAPTQSANGERKGLTKKELPPTIRRGVPAAEIFPCSRFISS